MNIARAHLHIRQLLQGTGNVPSFTITTATTNPGSFSILVFRNSSRGWVTFRQAVLARSCGTRVTSARRSHKLHTTTQPQRNKRSMPSEDGTMLPNSAKNTYSVSCNCTLVRQYLILWPRVVHCSATTYRLPRSLVEFWQQNTRLPVARRRWITWLCQDHVLEPLRTLYHNLLSVEGWPRQFWRDDGPLDERLCRTALVF